MKYAIQFYFIDSKAEKKYVLREQQRDEQEQGRGWVLGSLTKSLRNDI